MLNLDLAKLKTVQGVDIDSKDIYFLRNILNKATNERTIKFESKDSDGNKVYGILPYEEVNYQSLASSMRQIDSFEVNGNDITLTYKDMNGISFPSEKISVLDKKHLKTSIKDIEELIKLQQKIRGERIISVNKKNSKKLVLRILFGVTVLGALVGGFLLGRGSSQTSEVTPDPTETIDSTPTPNIDSDSSDKGNEATKELQSEKISDDALLTGADLYNEAKEKGLTISVDGEERISEEVSDYIVEYFETGELDSLKTLSDADKETYINKILYEISAIAGEVADSDTLGAVDFERYMKNCSSEERALYDDAKTMVRKVVEIAVKNHDIVDGKIVEDKTTRSDELIDAIGELLAQEEAIINQSVVYEKADPLFKYALALVYKAANRSFVMATDYIGITSQTQTRLADNYAYWYSDSELKIAYFPEYDGKSTHFTYVEKGADGKTIVYSYTSAELDKMMETNSNIVREGVGFNVDQAVNDYKRETTDKLQGLVASKTASIG